MNDSKAKIVINTIIGKVSSILGYAILVIMGLPLVIGSFGTDVAAYVIVVIFIVLGVWLIIIGSKTKRKIKRFKAYVGLISVEHITSLENLASSTSQSVDFVRNDLQKMIDKRFFANAHIDKGTNEIIVGSPNLRSASPVATQSTQPNMAIENENVKCQGCGAMNMKQRGTIIHCEYCGSPIK